MRFVVLSDTHCRHGEISVPEGDVLIHAGDFCNTGTFEEITDFALWFAMQPHKHKIVVPGNHDRNLANFPQLALRAFYNAVDSCHTNVELLIDSSVEIEGVKFYGSPWTPVFGDRWAFHKKRGDDIAKMWDKIPDDVQVLITHGPPFGVMDLTREGVNAGCEVLAKRLNLGFYPNLKLHVFGHIHEGYGIYERNGRVTANASVCTRRYEPINPPHAFDLEF